MNFDFDEILLRSGMAIIMSTIKNPHSDRAQRLENDLLLLADMIYMGYGYKQPERVLPGPPLTPPTS